MKTLLTARSKTAPCCERAGFGQISALISLNRQAIRLNRDENLPQTSTLSRRHLFLNGLLIALLGLAISATTFAVEIGDDGLHKQPWLETTFKDIREDIDTASEEGKRLLIIFEQRGCPYCKKMHETVFIDPEIVAYIEQHFFTVQYNLHGDEEVTDLDNDVLPENGVAVKWGLKYTPTLMFLPDPAEDAISAAQQAVAVMPGAADKETTFSMLRWVYERGYENSDDFQLFHQRRLEEEKS